MDAHAQVGSEAGATMIVRKGPKRDTEPRKPICQECYDLPHRRPKGKLCVCQEKFGTLPPEPMATHNYERTIWR